MNNTSNGYHRVVVTGLGAITPLGDVQSMWDNLVAGQSGIRRIQRFDPAANTVQIAGEVDFDPEPYLDKRDYKRMARSAILGQMAARFAIQDAGLSADELAAYGERVGVTVGTAQGGYEVAAASNIAYAETGRRPRPLELVNSLPSMPAYYVGREANATGPMLTLIAACASGTQAIGEGLRLLREGKVNVVVAGGTEALVEPYILEGLAAMTVLNTTSNDRPAEASRPFDAERSGFVYSEGAGFMVLETLSHAQQRDAQLYAEVMGYGNSVDNFHVTAPDEEGRGAARAMQWALDDAGLAAQDVDYINAHGTSTELNDVMETRAIKRVFGEYAYDVLVSSTKSMLGHCLGASGAVEAIASIMTIRHQTLHPTINLHTPDPDCDLDYVPNEARSQPVKTVLSNSFGFGGQNACLVFRAL